MFVASETGNMDNFRELAKTHGLDDDETQALLSEQYGLDYFKAMLVAEHNQVFRLFSDDTPMGKVEALRARFLEHSMKNNEQNYSKYDDLADDLKRDSMTSLECKEGYFKELSVIALLPEITWKGLQQVFLKFESYELLGQKRPRKEPETRPNPGFKVFTKLFLKLPGTEGKEVIDMLLDKKLAVKEITKKSQNIALRISVTTHLARFLSWDFTKKKFKDEDKQFSLTEIFEKFPTSKLATNSRILESFVAAIQGNLALAKAMPTHTTKLRFALRPKSLAVSMNRTWEALPDMFRTFVNNHPDTFPVENSIEQEVEPASEPGPENPASFSMTYPRGHVQEVAVELLILDAGNTFWDSEVAYVAAHLQLPENMDAFQTSRIVSSVIKNGDRFRLVVKVWCTEAQSEPVIRAMRTSDFERHEIQPHYLWESQSVGSSHNSNDIMSFKPTDVKIGFVGYFTDLNNFDGFVRTTNIHRSSIVYAPRIPQSQLSRVQPSGKTCPTEMNVAVPKDFILQHTMEGDWVADVLCGSGSAAVAAVTTGRNCLVVDLDPDMVSFNVIFASNIRLVMNC